MAVWSPGGVATTRGTSFAAPWITRKLAYLVHVMHLSREAAKALIIDAASGWEPISADNIKLGYGIVPTRIEDILETPSNEIRFVLEGTIDTFETYNYNIPVPMKDENTHTWPEPRFAIFQNAIKGKAWITPTPSLISTSDA